LTGPIDCELAGSGELGVERLEGEFVDRGVRRRSAKQKRGDHGNHTLAHHASPVSIAGHIFFMTGGETANTRHRVALVLLNTRGIQAMQARVVVLVIGN
jgi:hypothetical protein